MKTKAKTGRDKSGEKVEEKSDKKVDKKGDDKADNGSDEKEVDKKDRDTKSMESKDTSKASGESKLLFFFSKINLCYKPRSHWSVLRSKLLRFR